MNPETLITLAVIKAIKTLYAQDIDEEMVKLEPTNSDFKGDFTLLIFPFVKISKVSPEDTAKVIAQQILQQSESIADFNVVKGFLNLTLKTDFWLNYLNQIRIENYGQASKKPKEKIIIEYSSPNTNKPIHLGHIRNILLGYSLHKLLTYYGYDNVKVNLINDRGIHICKSMYAYKIFGNEATPDSTGIKGDHFVGNFYVKFNEIYQEEVRELIQKGAKEEDAKKNAPSILAAQIMLQKWEESDKDTIALWNKLNDWVYDGFKATYEKLGVSFDKYYYESNTYLLGKKMVEEGLNKNIFYKKPDKSIWIDLTADKLDQKLVQRSDGTSVYITQDLGTADLKYQEFGADKSIIVVGNEQDYHFKVLFKILEKLERPYAKGCYHLSYGMVDLPSGKMKSREGTVVDADELMAELIEAAKQKTDALGKTDGMTDAERESLHYKIGMAALKYYILKVDATKRMLFNPEESIDLQGDTGPFIQYSYARIKSILRQYNGKIEYFDTTIALQTTELELIKHIAHFSNIIQKAVNQYSPSLVANYAYSLAKIFNKLYAEVSFLKENDTKIKQNRITLIHYTATLLQTSMHILGIEMPEKM